MNLTIVGILLVMFCNSVIANMLKVGMLIVTGMYELIHDETKRRDPPPRTNIKLE